MATTTTSRSADFVQHACQHDQHCRYFYENLLLLLLQRSRLYSIQSKHFPGLAMNACVVLKHSGFQKSKGRQFSAQDFLFDVRVFSLFSRPYSAGTAGLHMQMSDLYRKLVETVELENHLPHKVTHDKRLW